MNANHYYAVSCLFFILGASFRTRLYFDKKQWTIERFETLSIVDSDRNQITQSNHAIPKANPNIKGYSGNDTAIVGNMYGCGYSLGGYETLFPRHQMKRLPNNLSAGDSYTSQDLLVVDGGWMTPSCRRKAFRAFVMDFPGKILFQCSESFDTWPILNAQDGTLLRDNFYSLGYFNESEHPHYIHMTFLQFVLMAKGPTSWKRILDPTYRPVATNRTRFLIYAQGHCQDYRDEAFDRLSSINVVYQGGSCGSKTINKELANDMIGNSWVTNIEHFSYYRFCLVMENTNKWGYITEKLLTAFEAGCVPIYYGSQETVFSMFNRRAFVFYDIENPEPAIEQVRDLERYPSKFAAMQQEPILARGEKTIRKYFSFVEELENAALVRHIWKRMGLYV